MTYDARYRRFERLTLDPSDHEEELYDLAVRLGASAEDLRSFAERYANGSESQRRYVAFAVGRAPWLIDPPAAELADITLDFVRRVAIVSHDSSLLLGVLNAFHGLISARLLLELSSDERGLVVDFLAHCLDVEDVVVLSRSFDIASRSWRAGFLSRVDESRLGSKLSVVADRSSAELEPELQSIGRFWIDQPR